jgi:ferredoxin
VFREIVSIDEDLCNGCGKCVPACAEGALKIVDGKAKIVSDVLCDGLGACLGSCPQGAIKIDRREAAPFDLYAVQQHQAKSNGPCKHLGVGVDHPANPSAADASAPASQYGCPSNRFAQFARKPDSKATQPHAAGDPPIPPANSELTHWPIQLRLLSAAAPVLRGARLLVAADCVPVAFAGFHSQLLRDHAVVIACPKLDDPSGYVEKLAEMIRQSDLTEITVAHMEVPCCSGILQMVLQARQLADSNVLVNDVVISVQGEVVTRRRCATDRMMNKKPERAFCPTIGAK